MEMKEIISSLYSRKKISKKKKKRETIFLSN